MDERNVSAHKDIDFSIARLTGSRDELLDAQDGETDRAEDKKYPDYCRTLTITDANGTVKELVFPKALDLDRPKRARTTFSAEQLYHLEREFQRNQYLVGRERTDLAHRLQLSETQVKVWFQNRRTKYKRDKTRESEEHKAHAESYAACNILRILQTQPSDQTPSPQPVPAHPAGLPPPPPPPHHHIPPPPHHPYLHPPVSLGLPVPPHPGFYST